jgi:hypothetical protein
MAPFFDRQLEDWLSVCRKDIENFPWGIAGYLRKFIICHHAYTTFEIKNSLLVYFFQNIN